jgi:hypothetical protein
MADAEFYTSSNGEDVRRRLKGRIENNGNQKGSEEGSKEAREEGSKEEEVVFTNRCAAKGALDALPYCLCATIKAWPAAAGLPTPGTRRPPRSAASKPHI